MNSDAPGSVVRELQKRAAIESVRRYPDSYNGLSSQQQSEQEVCLATLMAIDCHSQPPSKVASILPKIAKCLPDFQHHKVHFMRFVDWGHASGIEQYMLLFGQKSIWNDRDFVKEAIQRDRFGHVFRYLSEPLRSDSELLKLAAESVYEACLGRLINATPRDRLVQNEFLIYRVLEQDNTLHFDERQVPASLWRKKDFILKWIAQGRAVSSSFLPKELNTDRELCIAIYKSHCLNSTFNACLNWVTKSFHSDKSFIRECLSHSPLIFERCKKLICDDIDMFMAAAVSAARYDWIPFFIEKLTSSTYVLIGSEVCKRLNAFDEFTTFLACSWKSRQISAPPLCIMDCDEETARGLKTEIADFLGFHAIENALLLKQFRKELVSNVIQNGNFRIALIPLIPPKVLMEGVIETIECLQHVMLSKFPDKIWSQRVFVKWAASCGMFHKAISDVFAADADICLMYYGFSSTLREQVLPWISDSLKQDPDFVYKCMQVDPLIMNHCKGAAIRYDFKVLHTGVQLAVAQGKMDDLAEAALDHGWADSLVFYAKAVRAKLEDYYSFQAYEFHSRANYFACENSIWQLIADYLDVPFPQGTRDLDEAFSNRSVFALAMGGTVEELCKYRECLSKRPKHESICLHDTEDEDDEENDERDDDMHHGLGMPYYFDDEDESEGTNADY